MHYTILLMLKWRQRNAIKGEQMQNYNNNQSQPNNSNNYYHDPLDESADIDAQHTENDGQMLAAPEPQRDEPPMLNQDVNQQAPQGEAGQMEAPADNAELEAYLEATKKLLAFTRKERNNLIVKIDEEEDRITAIRNKRRAGATDTEMIDYSALSDMRKRLDQKNNLINALVSILGTIG